MFWSKKTHKSEQIAANKERDRKVRAHNLHMQMDAAQKALTEGSMAHAENPEPEAGIDEDLVSQLGREGQKAKEFVHARTKQLKSMRSRIRKGRRNASSCGRSLGF